ncbi:hypothetical protein MVEN_01093100 [Mycena venus]|uniref:F-box domain-containing protein n=1 Tax=Mycena venus TaxID=2733690 RepID=A0A8H6Y7W4_9AGAR|nr:hypothetical protein MVEN_01093100 [Mycena venus]
MPSPILPPEVIDLIIDNLHDQPSTLRACSLVGRNWLDGSRHHLFNRIYLTARNLGVFRDLLKSPSNTLSFHLRHLHATGFQAPDLIQLLPLLPALSHLHWLSIYRNLILHDDAVLGAGTFPLIRSLTLSRTSFTSRPGLSDFLSRFPSLKKLALDPVSVSQRESPTLSALTNLNLDTLKMTNNLGLLRWLRWTGFALRAQSIELNFEEMEMEVSEFFDALGPQLERLTLKFRNPRQLTSFSEESRLPHNTRLRCLRIGQAFCILGESDIGVSLSLARLLRHLESSGIQELIFDTVLVHPQLNWHHSPPQEVAAILDGGNFARLRKIVFNGPWDRPDDILRKQFQSIVLALFPRQGSRGTIYVNTHSFE